MGDIVSISAIFGLIIVIGFQMYDRWQFADREEREKKRLMDQIEKANTALIAKDANSYVMMRSMDKVRDEEPKEEPEGVDVSELDDESYDRMLKNQLKVGN